MERNRNRLHVRLRKALSTRAAGRAFGRLAARAPLAGRFGLAPGAVAVGEAAGRHYGVVRAEDRHPTEGDVRAQCETYAAELGEAYAGGSLVLKADLSVCGVPEATVFSGSGAVLAGRPRRLLVRDATLASAAVANQVPVLPRRSLRVAGPAHSMLATPSGGAHYYHYIFDTVRFALAALRLSPALAEGTLLVRPDPAPFQAAVHAALAARHPRLAIRDVPVDARVEVEELVVVARRRGHEIADFAGRDDLEEISALYRAAHGVGSPTPRRRIYVSRERVRLRRTVNERALAAALAARGFETVHPQEMSHAEQVRTFAEAETVVGTGGAALANCLFCAAGTRLVEICPIDSMYPFYCGLALQRGMHYRFVPGSRTRALDAFSVDVDAVLAALER